MSIHVITRVMKHSEARLGARLVLLVLADHANADGTGAWPSVTTIAAHARLSERAVRYELRQLERDGEIKAVGKGPAGTTNYTVSLGADIAPANPAPGKTRPDGGQNPTADVSDFAPEPSLTRPTSPVPSLSSVAKSSAEGEGEGMVEFDPNNLVGPPRLP
jgi:hypothetical protein